MAPDKNRKSLKPLPNEIRSIVRSGITINNVAQCVEELVYNSIDAGARNIYIGINLDQFNVRVDDDGVGFSEVDLGSAGIRYNTSKCSTLDDLKKLSYYGFRGEALASIVDVSSMVDIITRPKSTAGVELKKKFENGHVKGFTEKLNTSTEKSGTSVIVAKLLSRLPVRQQRIDKSIQLEDIKSSLERISLINPSLSIELRNEKSGIQIFSFKPVDSYSEAINQMYQSRIGFEVKFIQEHYRHEKFFFNLSVCSDFVRKKYYQFVFLNNRFIRRCSIHKCVGNCILDRRKDDPNSSKLDKYPLFILNIECPFSEYDITLEPKKQVVEFKDRDALLSGIEGLVSKLKHRHSFTVLGNNLECKDKNASLISSYDVRGALHSRFIAREKGGVPATASRSFTESDVGSLGQSSASIPEKKLATTSRNLSRTGHSTHFVNVREIRKKRKLENIFAKKQEPVPFKPKLSPAATKPRLTLGAFNKFSVWEGAFEKAAHLPAKRFKASEDPHKNYKYQAHGSLPNEAMSQNEGSVGQEGFNWKINRYMQHYQPGAEVTAEDGHEVQRQITLDNSIHDRITPLRTNAPMSILSSNNVRSIHSSLQLQPGSNQLNLKNPGNDDKSHVKDDGSQLISRSEKFLNNHLKEKWTLKHVKEDIVGRLEKYWKLSLAEDLKSSGNMPNTDNVSVTKVNLNQGTESRSSIGETTAVEVCGIPLHPFIALAKPPSVSAAPKLNDDRATACETAITNCAPPLMDLFPLQKSFSLDWNDKMMSNDYNETDEDLFPSDWSAEIVMDIKGQEWLLTVDDAGKNIYINLSSGQRSSDMIHLSGSVRKATANEIKKSNPASFNWLRRHFHRGFKQFWNGGEKREIAKEGDLAMLNNTTIGNSLLKCINDRDQNDPGLSKWNESELQNLSKYFTGSSELSMKTVNDATSTGIQCWKSLGGVTSTFRFSREDFELIRVIGQYDRKFILAGVRKSSKDNETLVIFDQHAVHERVRLEKFIDGSFKNPKAAKKYLKETEMMPPYQLHLSDTEVRIMQNYMDFFRQAALNYELVNSTSVKLKSVPKCFAEKCTKEPTASREDVFKALVHDLIQELIHIIMDTKVATLTAIPKAVHTVLCSQACHGAIKFGDALDLDACKQLICELRSCKNLFQCAHGRPSVVPLIRGDDLLKTATIGNNYLLERQQTTLNSSYCLPSHEECSNYFCNPTDRESSAYFGITDSTADGTTKNDSVQFSQAPLSFFASTTDDVSINITKNATVSAASDFASFLSNEKSIHDNDDEDSPYFFNMY